MATVKYSPYKGVFTDGDVITATLDWFDEAEELYFVWAFGLGVYEPMDYKTAVDAGVVTVSGRTVTLKRLVKDEEDARKVFVFRRTLLKTAAEQTSLDAIPLAAMLAELEELRRCAEDAKVEAEKALRVPEDDQDTTHFTDRETRAGQIAGFDDRGNPAVGKGVRQIQEIYELFDKMLALYEDVKKLIEEFRKDLAEWEEELKKWAEEFVENLKKWIEEFMKKLEELLESMKQYRFCVITREEYDALCRAGKIDDGSIYFVKGTFDVGFVFYDLLKEYFPDIIRPIEEGPFEGSEDLRRVAVLDKPNEFNFFNRFFEQCEVMKAPTSPLHLVRLCDLEDWDYGEGKGYLVAKVFDDVVPTTGASVGKDENGYLRVAEATASKAGVVRLALSVDDAGGVMTAAKTKEAIGLLEEKVASNYAKFEGSESTAETGAKHGKSLLASQNGEDGGFYVGANRSATRAWTQYLTRYRQTGVRAYGETNGEYEDYLWSPRTADDEPLRVARIKDIPAAGGTLTVDAGNELKMAGTLRWLDSEGNTAVSMRFTDSPTGGVLNQGSASTTAAMTWMSGNYMSWFSGEFVRLYSGYSSESGISPTSKIEANPNGVILAAGANDATKIVVDSGKIQVSGAPLTLNVAPTATNHATTKGYVDDKVASLEADYAKFEAGTSTAETGAKHGKSLLASQNGEDGGFYVGANKSATRAWTQNMTRYRQTGVRAYGETTGKHEDYLWSPQTEEDEPLRVARLKDFAAMEAKIAALKERIEALEELPAEGYIRLRIETTSANQSFPLFHQITTEEGGYVSVDWGDGNKETLTGKTTYSPVHTYAAAGEYIVKLTGSKFTGINGSTDSYADFQAAIREILSLKMPKDSTSVSLSNTFYYCVNLTGNIPAWDDCITSAYGTYHVCSGLTGSIPEWGANITNAYATYNDCPGLTGNIPAWGEKITNARGTYYRCSGLTGSIPEWGVNITNAYATYNGCTGLTGSIPEWGVNITNAYATYNGCTGLTGSIPEWGANITNAGVTYQRCTGLTGSIPEWGVNITNAQNTYNVCRGLTGSIPAWGANITNARVTYGICTGLTGNIPAWGESITDAQNTYDGCRSLTGNIPAWGANITNAYATYRNCSGLTGCSEELLQDPMPSRITSHASCVSGCVSAIRQHFTPDWGGTKEELPGTGDIRLRIQTTSANQSFPLFYQITTEEGGYVSVDWGDGNTETLTGATTYSPEHTYATAGEYVVKLTGSKFTAVKGIISSIYNDFQDAVREILSLKMPTDSTSVSLSNAFYYCTNLTGSIPAWDDCITSAYGTYRGCSGLTGSIPEWGANITNATATYNGCTGLTGNIPAWGAKITTASNTYYNCSGLTGCSAELLQDPMPSRITEHAFCVLGCVDAIRQHFTKDWGGTKPA